MEHERGERFVQERDGDDGADGAESEELQNCEVYPREAVHCHDDDDDHDDALEKRWVQPLEVEEE